MVVGSNPATPTNHVSNRCAQRYTMNYERSSNVCPPGEEVTQLLQAARAGEREALDHVMRQMYDQLHALAKAQLRKSFQVPGNDDGMCATVLVNEAFLRVFPGQRMPELKDSQHLLGTAGRAMRHVLIDLMRRHAAEKRPQQSQRVSLTEVGSSLAVEMSADDLDSALEKLERLDERQARIVELRFFVGLTEEEIAAVLGISSRTVKRDWRIARVWLERELTP